MQLTGSCTPHNASPASFHHAIRTPTHHHAPRAAAVDAGGAAGREGDVARALRDHPELVGDEPCTRESRGTAAVDARGADDAGSGDAAGAGLADDQALGYDIRDGDRGRAARDDLDRRRAHRGYGDGAGAADDEAAQRWRGEADDDRAGTGVIAFPRHRGVGADADGVAGLRHRQAVERAVAAGGARTDALVGHDLDTIGTFDHQPVEARQLERALGGAGGRRDADRYGRQRQPRPPTHYSSSLSISTTGDLL